MTDFSSQADYTPLGNRHGLDWAAVSPADWGVAVRTELEHRDVTDGDLDLTAKIALAHLREDPNYYKMLEPNERVAEAYWAARGGPPSVTKKTGGGTQASFGFLSISIAVLVLVLVLIVWMQRPAAVEGFWCGTCERTGAHFPRSWPSWPSYDPAMLPGEVINHAALLGGI